MSDYTLHDKGTVVLAGTEYRVEDQVFANGNKTTWLYGPRGATNMLVGFSNRENLYKIVSFPGGHPKTSKGNALRVKYNEAGELVKA